MFLKIRNWRKQAGLQPQKTKMPTVSYSSFCLTSQSDGAHDAGTVRTSRRGSGRWPCGARVLVGQVLGPRFRGDGDTAGSSDPSVQLSQEFWDLPPLKTTFQFLVKLE